MMNRADLLLLGAVLTVLVSLAGLVVAPAWQQRDLVPVAATDGDGDAASHAYPPSVAELGETVGRGRQVYRAEGCIYCHSQQVRAAAFGADIARGWGERRSVPRDYLGQAPPLLGTMRTGPDVANIGSRQPSDAWHHVHLYDARLVSPGSVMPPFGYMYARRATDPGPGGVALPTPAGAPPAWIVPDARATALVRYLHALHQDRSLEAVQ